MGDPAISAGAFALGMIVIDLLAVLVLGVRMARHGWDVTLSRPAGTMMWLIIALNILALIAVIATMQVRGA